MPILDFTDLEDGRFDFEKDGGLDLAWVKTFSAMLFPSNEEARFKFQSPIAKNSELVCKKEITKYLEKFKNPKAISEIEFKRAVKKAAKKTLAPFIRLFEESGGEDVLVNSPPFLSLVKDLDQMVKKGFVAGNVLTLIFLLSHQGKKSGVLQAVNFINDSSEPVIMRGRSKILEAWSQFKPVSHLWAASAHCYSGPYETVEDFMYFYSLSELFRNFGENHFARAQKEPTLSPDITWKIPPSFPLFEITFDGTSFVG
jgi:hypothetical protein